MSATVLKLPKEYRVAQRWVATCDDHMGRGETSVKPRTRGSGYEPWRSFMRRRAMDARKDAARHDRIYHPEVTQ